MEPGEVAVFGCLAAAAFIGFVLTPPLIAYFYFNLPILLTVIAILVLTRVLLHFAGGDLVTRMVQPGLALYPNIAMLAVAFAFQLFAHTTAEYVTLALLIPINVASYCLYN
jgi:hypothetical protein